MSDLVDDGELQGALLYGEGLEVVVEDLRAQLAASQALVAELAAALGGLQREPSCWCGRDQHHPWANIHPGYQVHSPSCDQARAALAKAGRKP